MIARGPEVKHGLNVGDTVFVDASFTERAFQKLPDSNNFICPDNYVFGKKVGKLVIPFGRKILLLRDTGEQQHGNITSVVEAQPGSDQSLFGTVVALGILPRIKQRTKKIKPVIWRVNGIGIGDRVRIDKWNENMVELNVRDDYYLIVNEENLLYREES